MALTYTTFKTQIANLMAQDEDGDAFTTMFPGLIDYAENRIYRDLDLLSTVVRDSSTTTTALTRDFTLPSAGGRFVTVEGVNVITPASTAAASGTRTPLLHVARDYLDYVWGSVSGATVPEYFSMITDQTIILGPWPLTTYYLEVIGTIRPTALSSGNTTTFLTNYLPDLFIAAAMVFASGYMRNFGAQSDNPQMAASWEAQYQALKASANVEELRKKFAGPGWTSHSEVAPAPER